MKLKKIIIGSFSFLIIFGTSYFVSPVVASTSSPDSSVTSFSERNKQTDAFMTKAGFSASVEADAIIGVIVSMLLSLLAILFIVLMIFSGYQWMTAGGNEEQVKKAQSRIKNAVIGLIVVVLAYAVTAFVFKNLPGGPQTTTGGGTGENANQ